jgi:hypothetical protein
LNVCFLFLLLSDQASEQNQGYPALRSTGQRRCAASLGALPFSMCCASFGCSVYRPRHVVGRLRAGVHSRMSRCARFAAASGKSYQDSQLSRDSRSRSGTGVRLGRGCDAVTSADGRQRSSCGPSTTQRSNKGQLSRVQISKKKTSAKTAATKRILSCLLTMAYVAAAGFGPTFNGSGTGDDGPVRGSQSPQRARESR